MKVLLDIKDNKADFILELLRGFPSYVKTKPISKTKVQLIEDLNDAASDVRLHKRGKIKLKTAQEFVKTFAKEQKDWWDELTESQQHAIDESIAEMKAVKLTAHADVMKKYNSISSGNVQGLPRTQEYKDRHNH